MTTSDPPSAAEIEAKIGVSFRDRAMLRTALTHPSYANEHPEDPTETNERLEFLGDAALGLIVAEALYERFPDRQEGSLTAWRAELVCGPTLARVATQIGIGPWLRLGRGEEATGGREREGNLERAYEALIGAILIDRGLDAARDFVRRTLNDDFEALARDPAVLNPKGALQQIAQGLGMRPEYLTVAIAGPEHERWFTVEVRLGEEALGAGEGATRQQAEKEAAREALETLQARLSATDAAHDGGGGG